MCEDLETVNVKKKSMKNIYEILRTARGALTALVTCILLLASTAGVGQVATVTTDKVDYIPGEIVFIGGSGWLPGETVLLVIDHLIYTNYPSDTLSAVAMPPVIFTTTNT